MIKIDVCDQLKSLRNKVQASSFNLCCLLTVSQIIQTVRTFWWEFVDLDEYEYWELTHTWFQNIQYLLAIYSKELPMLIDGFLLRSCLLIFLWDNVQEKNNL